MNDKTKKPPKMPAPVESVNPLKPLDSLKQAAKKRKPGVVTK